MSNKGSKRNKKKYCDKHFKTQLAKALKLNFGEPENFEKIKANKLLANYDSEKIINYTNSLAKDIQCNIESEIGLSRTKEIIELTKTVDNLIGLSKSHEIPLLAKLNSFSEVPEPSKTNNVNFDALNKYLYTAISGSLDCVDMNDETLKVLEETYNKLMLKVDEDSPKVLEDLRSKINDNNIHPHVNENYTKLSEALQDYYINPLNIPKEYLIQNKSSK